MKLNKINLRTSVISVLPEAINNVAGKIDTVFTNGGYNSGYSFPIPELETKVLIPPRINVVINKCTHQRNEDIEYILEHGKSLRKRKYDYHQRALVENLFSRWKTIYGENIRYKNSEAQQT